MAACPSGAFVIGCLFLAPVSVSDIAAIAVIDVARLRATVQPMRTHVGGSGLDGRRSVNVQLNPESLREDEFERLVALQGVCSAACMGRHDPTTELVAAHAVGCDLEALPPSLTRMLAKNMCPDGVGHWRGL